MHSVLSKTNIHLHLLIIHSVVASQQHPPVPLSANCSTLILRSRHPEFRASFTTNDILLVVDRKASSDPPAMVPQLQKVLVFLIQSGKI
jgi:hypothetical protein